jgi:hypothetical protein
MGGRAMFVTMRILSLFTGVSVVTCWDQKDTYTEKILLTDIEGRV